MNAPSIPPAHPPLRSLPAPALQPLMDLQVEVAAPIELGDLPAGRRRVIPITGGQVQGRLGSGRVLAGGADWQWVLEGRVAQLEAHYVLEFDGGRLVAVHNRALRVASAETTAALLRGEVVDPRQVYFRCQPRFETAVPEWRWLMERQFVGTGQREPATVRMSFFSVE